MKKPTEYKRFKFNQDSICTNPDTAFEHKGTHLEYKIMIAEHQLGFSAGYSWITYNTWPAPVEDSFVEEIVNKGNSFPNKIDALHDAAQKLRERLDNLFKATLGRSKADLKPLYDYWYSLSKGEIPEASPASEDIPNDIPKNEADATPANDAIRYSDEDLEEFKALIDQKLTTATKELDYLQGLIDKDHSKSSDDQLTDMPIDQLLQMKSRQLTFIDHLQKAMVRIENKSYGICRVTGKLIDKARLKAVPHATLSIEAKTGAYVKESNSVPAVTTSTKKAASKKVITPTAEKEEVKDPVIERGEETKDWECEICGCTDRNCIECVKKTGEPCHWVAPNLCSACVATQQKESIKSNDMFFTPLYELMDGIDVTMKFSRRNGLMIVEVIPEASGPIHGARYKASPAELDEGFLRIIHAPIEMAKGIKIELDDFKKSIETQRDEKKKELGKETKSAPAKSNRKSSAARKHAKPVTKKAAPKKAAKPAKKITVKPAKPEPVDIFAGVGNNS